jgi:hypothetical protein
MIHKDLKQRWIAQDLVRAFTLSRADIRIASALPTSRISSAGARSEWHIAMLDVGDH